MADAHARRFGRIIVADRQFEHEPTRSHAQRLCQPESQAVAGLEQARPRQVERPRIAGEIRSRRDHARPPRAGMTLAVGRAQAPVGGEIDTRRSIEEQRVRAVRAETAVQPSAQPAALLVEPAQPQHGRDRAEPAIGGNGEGAHVAILTPARQPVRAPALGAQPRFAAFRAHGEAPVADVVAHGHRNLGRPGKPGIAPCAAGDKERGPRRALQLPDQPVGPLGKGESHLHVGRDPGRDPPGQDTRGLRLLRGQAQLASKLDPAVRTACSDGEGERHRIAAGPDMADLPVERAVQAQVRYRPAQARSGIVSIGSSVLVEHHRLERLATLECIAHRGRGDGGAITAPQGHRAPRQGGLGLALVPQADRVLRHGCGLLVLLLADRRTLARRWAASRHNMA
ncbi:hypothetical protein J4558_24545 [Leptolyngbya sp. 15MV]|nr:hypothetical protein J4558_24545 [Leptolyngbya sp. 15MV]